jgi:hypothetical protein
MRARRFSRRFFKLILPAIACTTTAVARGDLMFDLRAASVNGAALSGAQTQHSIPSAGVGDVIAFDVYVLITGTDANFFNDRVVQVDGAFHSTSLFAGAGPFGDLTMDVVRTVYDPKTGDIVMNGFDAPSFSVGLQQDLDADGDLDVGSNIDSSDAHYWAARFQASSVGSPAGPPNGRKVGFGTFTVTSASAGSTLLRFVGRNANTAGNYFQDGVFMHGPTVDSTVANSILVSTVPEPSIAIAGAGAGLFALHRRRRRRRPAEELARRKTRKAQHSCLQLP